MQDSCADVILGQNFLQRHETVVFEFGGVERSLKIPAANERVVALTAAKVDPPRLFEFMQPDYKPVAARTRSYSHEDQTFIRSEIS